MSTVLTNGIIIPDNGSRNWGGDLANNWNIIDVNVGYMNDVKNRVTTLENSVAENTANIQINASNISALQTSKQNALSEEQIANIADVTNKANDTDVVHKTGNENVSGVKTFSNDLRIVKTSPFYAAFCSGYIKGQAPASNLNSGVRFFDDINSGSNDTITGGFEIEYNRDGYNKSYISSRNYAGEIHKNFTVGLRVPNDDTRSIDFLPSVNDIINLGTSTNKWKDIYATNATINTSDRNAKQDIKIIDDNILEAWGNVSLVSFKFKDAVAKKGDNARLHTGYIAQNIQEELNKYGIDACNYGLFCYNSWDAQEEKSHEEERTDEEGNVETVKVIDTPARDAGETYGLRYIECLVVECAYLRKKNKELEGRIAKLEEKFN